MKLSIITTLYKSEPFIHRCLDSLLNQDIPYEDYELIIVDDGSPDNCVEIIESEYCTRYPNIIIVRQNNKGLPEARNMGLRNAHGRYVTFVDPDDYVEAQIYGILLKKMDDENLDMIRFNYSMIEESTYRTLPKYKESLINVDYTDEVVDGQMFLGRKLGFACYVWQFLFKLNLFLENGIFFREKVFDDADVLPRVLLHVNRITSVDKNVYCYLQRGGSLVNVLNQTAARKKINGFLFIVEKYNDYSKMYLSPYAIKWFRSAVTSSFVGILQTAAKYDYSNRNEYINAFNKVNGLKYSSYNRAFKKRVHHFLLSVLGPCLYCSVYHSLHKD